MPEKRIGVIGLVIENPAHIQEQLNGFISMAGDIIIGRLGVPYRQRNVSVMALMVDGTVDAVNTLTGHLGSLPGVNVRAALTKA